MKNFAIVAVLVLAMSSSMFAQAKPGGIARQAAMGGSQAGTGLVLNPFIMDDASLMLVNPAYQAMYKDYGWANVAGGGITGLSTGGGQIGDDGYGHQNAGVAFSLNNEWNVGAILSYDPSAINFVNGLIGNISQRGPQNMPAVVNVWEAVVSHRSGSMDLGFGVMYGWSNTDLKASATGGGSTDNEASSKLWGFRVGLNNDLGGGSSFDASAALRLDKATDNLRGTNAGGAAANGGDYSASGTELEFHARGKFHVSNKFNFVPYGTFINMTADPKEDAVPTGATATTSTDKNTVSAYALGVGGEYRSGGLYIAGGMSWQSAQIKNEHGSGNPATNTTTTVKYSALPVVNVGGEWWFLDWLGGRMGYHRSIGSISAKVEQSGASPSATAEANSTSNFLPGFGFLPIAGVNSSIAVGAISPANWDGLVTLGVCMKFGAFALDATVSDEALRRGVGLIGAQDNINTFGYMTASYNFGE